MYMCVCLCVCVCVLVCVRGKILKTKVFLSEEFYMEESRRFNVSVSINHH